MRNNSQGFALIAVLLLLAIVAAGGYFLYTKSPKQIFTPPSVSQNNATKSESNGFNFENPKKSAHYETNTPAHGVVLAGIPINVVIDFNFDLGKGSYIQIRNDEGDQSELADYGVGDTVIDRNKLSMRRQMDPTAPDGLYTIVYNACWPDGSCHDGYFQFAIDRSLSDSFEDMTGKAEVEIDMADIEFKPMNIKISKGTKVTWVNSDIVEHFVNTDSHPAHTYFLDQNSRALGEGEKYSITFDKAGIYPYHCSAHEATMKGEILVE